jgi:hypothetical protein
VDVTCVLIAISSRAERLDLRRNVIDKMMVSQFDFNDTPPAVVSID